MREKQSPPGQWSRRAFVKATSAGVAGAWYGLGLQACGGGEHPIAADAGPDALAPTCGALTAPSIEGPFYSPGSPLRTNLREPGMTGTLLRLRGRVLSPSCDPIAGALLDFWQADSDGGYDNVGFTLRGHQLTDAGGGFLLQTVLPGHYLNGSTFRPAHIHVKVGGDGFLLLTTQLYFEGDPYNDTDPFIHESLIMPLEDGDQDVKEASFDFVLARA